jgi:putative peptidoglycan lipid II flippase
LIRRGAASFGFALLPATRGRLVRIALAALAMAGLLWLAAQLPVIRAPLHGLGQAVSIALAVAGAATIYLLMLALFGIAGWREAVNAIGSARPRDLRS